MTKHVAWAADEFLLDQGFVITEAGRGLPRTAVRGSLAFPLAARCRCPWCPPPRHPNYRIEWEEVTAV